MPDSIGQPAGFPSQTAWSAVIEVRDGGSPDRRQRMEELVSSYWKPVYWHLVRRWNLRAEDAADLTQEFFLKLFDQDELKGASPERGRFRTFLKLKLKDLVIEDLRRSSAQKRGGARRFVAIDGVEGLEPRWQGQSPEEAFDRDWALCLMGEATKSLEGMLKADGKEVVYRAFQACVLAAAPKSYRDCASELGIGEGDVRNYVFRARNLLKDIVRRHVRESVGEDAEVDGELAYLMDLVGRSP